MKVPLSWLREYVDVTISPKELGDLMTFSGVEVEGIEQVGPALNGVVVGEVLTKNRHPNADRLWLCDVNDGTAIRKVVCGADNFQVGDKAAFAPSGVTLPNGLTLKKAKIRGEVSEGMLCAPDELGLSDDHSGILLLDRSSVVGTPAKNLIPGGDTVLDLEITWNRPDCLSIIGIAREVAALLGKPLRIPEARVVDGPGAAPDITIEAADLCARYVGRKFEAIKLGPSPVWLQNRLTLCGVRPINNVVDITNYVMLECGQPLHAFDFDLLQQGRVVVRRATKQETLATLDGASRPLTDDTLVIADGSRPVALAGVMGGAGSEIRETTVRVLLESATFDAPSIKRTSTRLGLATESSHRFERGVDAEGAGWASDRASALLIELAGAVPSGPRVDCYPGRQSLKHIACRFARVRALLGVDVANDEIVSVLESLGAKAVERTNDHAVMEIPSFRRDLEREADLIEEIARMRGLDKIPEVVPMARIVPGAGNRHASAVSRVRHQLASLGLLEVYHYSFLSPKLLDRFQVVPECRVHLPNPVSADHSVMRGALIPQLVETLGRNQSRQVEQAALFELGTVFLPGPNGSVLEEERVAIGLMGPVGRLGLATRKAVSNDEMYGWAKGIVDELASLNGAERLRYTCCDVAICERGTAAEIHVGTSTAVMGQIGLVRQDLRSDWRIPGPVAVVELTLAALLGDGAVRPLKAVPTFPSVARDVAMTVGLAVTHDTIVKVIQGAAPRELTGVELFDIYRGKGVDGGRKSMAYSLRYQAADRTLTDEEANRFHDAIKQALRAALAAEIREG